MPALLCHTIVRGQTMHLHVLPNCRTPPAFYVKLFSYRLQRYEIILKCKTFRKNILTFQNKQDDYNGMYSQPDKEKAAGTVLNASLPFLKSDECEKVKGQLSYIVQDMKDERQQNQSRGLHM